MRGRRLERRIRHAGLRDPRNRLGPVERRFFLFREQGAGFAPRRNEHEPVDRQACFQQIMRMQIDAIGAAVDLRHAQIDEMDEKFGQIGMADIGANAGERFHAAGRDGDVIETLGDGSFLLLVGRSQLAIVGVDDKDREQLRRLVGADVFADFVVCAGRLEPALAGVVDFGGLSSTWLRIAPTARKRR